MSLPFSLPWCLILSVCVKEFHSLQLPMSKEILLGERVCRSHQLKMSQIGPGCSPSDTSRQRDIIQVREGLWRRREMINLFYLTARGREVSLMGENVI